MNTCPFGSFIPPTPDAGTAREWALRELSQPIYQKSPSWISAVIEFFVRLWDSLLGAGSSLHLWQVLALVGLGILLVVVVALSYLQPWRGLRDTRHDSSPIMDGDHSYRQLLDLADEAAAASDLDRAFVARFRALYVRFCHLGVLIDLPGVTAWEAMGQSGMTLPELASDLHQVGQVFDAIRFGHGSASMQQYCLVSDLVGRAEKSLGLSTVGVAT